MRDVTLTDATSKFSTYNYNDYLLKIQRELHSLNKVSHPYFIRCFLPSLVFVPSYLHFRLPYYLLNLF